MRRVLQNGFVSTKLARAYTVHSVLLSLGERDSDGLPVGRRGSSHRDPFHSYSHLVGGV